MIIDENKKEEIFKFLDGLRRSGITNMFGSSIYIEENYNLDKETSISIVQEWMKTFNERKNDRK